MRKYYIAGIRIDSSNNQVWRFRRLDNSLVIILYRQEERGAATVLGRDLTLEGMAKLRREKKSFCKFSVIWSKDDEHNYFTLILNDK